MLNVIFSEKFIEQFESLPQKTKILAEKKIALFQADPRNPSLKTHKLHGALREYLSFSVDHKTRIVFEYGTKSTIHFLKIGDHAIYR